MKSLNVAEKVPDRKMLIPIMPVFILLLTVPAVMGAEFDKTSTVSWVLDGSTFEIATGERIRLADIGVPAINESGGGNALARLVDLAYNKTVYLDVDNIYQSDSQGRLVCVAYVEHNSTHYLNINKALLDEGFATLADSPNEFSPGTWTRYITKPGFAWQDYTLYIVAGAAAVAIAAVAIYFVRRK